MAMASKEFGAPISITSIAIPLMLGAMGILVFAMLLFLLVMIGLLVLLCGLGAGLSVALLGGGGGGRLCNSLQKLLLFPRTS